MSMPPPPGYPSGPPPGYPMQTPPPTHGKATTGLILGIVSLVMCGLLTGIPAMIVSRQAKREIAASNGQLGGDGLATAGFVTGLIGTILSVLGALALIALIAFGTAVSDSFEEACNEMNQDGAYTISCYP